MPKNEDGEFELVVGNRQLLSIVFIMMVLFGVVFSMGYFVGRNSAPEAPANHQVAGVAQPPASATPAAQPAAATPAPATTAAGDTPLEPGEAKVLTQPVSTPGPQPPAAQPAPPAAETAAPKPIEAAKPAEAGPQPGEVFLQVAAVPRSEAELVVDVLKKRGYPALVAPIVPGQPEGALWRALVGPLKDAAAVAKTRSDLQGAGFKEVFVRKY